ncbi:MAG: hypothetical protein J7L11_04700 [Thermoprotei archaeon]|nr:hypothetical protein [Thermoprotei archaeon]
MQPFAKLPEVPRSSDVLIEVAFSRGGKKAASVRGTGPRIERERRKEIARIRTIRAYLRRRLRAIYLGYPRLDQLHPFLQGSHGCPHRGK